MKYGYARVSTVSQNYTVQIQQLKQSGVESNNIYSDKWTGATTDRPAFNELMNVLKDNDEIIITKLDRLARNTREALTIIEPLLERNITIKVLNLGTIENTTMGKMILRTLLSVAEMERDLILERTREGKAIAKRRNPNFREGRPKALKTPQREHANNLLKEYTYTEVAEMTGYSKSTLQRIKKQYEK